MFINLLQTLEANHDIYFFSVFLIYTLERVFNSFEKYQKGSHFQIEKS